MRASYSFGDKAAKKQLHDIFDDDIKLRVDDTTVRRVKADAIVSINIW